MALNIETFDNCTGGNVLYKVLAHPQTALNLRTLFQQLSSSKIALYDPLGILEAFQQFYLPELQLLKITHIYVQKFEHIGKDYPLFGNITTRPLTELSENQDDVLFILSFEKDLMLSALTPYLPKGLKVYSLDDIRLEVLAGERNYLTPLNFATNFAFFREQDGFHTRLITANYWHRYGAKDVKLSCTLFGEEGQVLAEWEHPLNASEHTIVLDSQEIKKKFNLSPFTGQLFIHVIGAKGHDIVKYALETYTDDHTHVSCTHDANSWPADSYAGLPAPHQNEQVYFWIQNSHPVPIPANSIGINVMGKKDVVWLDRQIAPFATYRLNVADLLPNVRWPQQIEVQAGKYVVRPRYEIICKSTNNQRIAHINVQRNDLQPTITPAHLKPLFGKNYILPAPILPQSDFQSLVLPTPMCTQQTHLPLKVFVYDATGQAIAEHSLGVLERDHATVVDCGQWSLPSGFGHIELAYDEGQNISVDGWLHGLFRYEKGPQKAETSFGAHIFNTPLVYKNEPQSYAGSPPGLRTRLFLALSDSQSDTTCFLIYPSSTQWHPYSETNFVLHDHQGKEISSHSVKIPCSGSFLFSYHKTFPEELRTKAKGGYIIIRDTTCRLFGYHGTWGNQDFSFDHMFGF
ncbi:MAG: hypothetical protein FJX71_01560 [Alphaproteobacteria bacterium]|nr:hypothetical protein [Alphaproteobacteria bacterium]